MRQMILAALVCLQQGAAVAQDAVAQGKGAMLRGLDKVDGNVVDLPLANGERTELGRLGVELRECRYPQGAAGADAYAFLTVDDTTSGNILFQGWMIASSPALNALEHPRYDVWVLRCKTE